MLEAKLRVGLFFGLRVAAYFLLASVACSTAKTVPGEE
jgi:hypothetical protein